jgi:hypothetical protein
MAGLLKPLSSADRTTSHRDGNCRTFIAGAVGTAVAGRESGAAFSHLKSAGASPTISEQENVRQDS